MAKHKRTPAKGKPITSHQLFPAVVALWFGALFGLGSLAVRPSLLEGLVLSSHVDLAVPAAAPPLGVTARIMVALIMAMLGVSIGIGLAGRIARPRPAAAKRRRSGRELGRAEAPPYAHHADASARRPRGPAVPARADLPDPEDTGPGASILANRRRALAIEPEEMEFVPHDLAPLPGGIPQIFDISEVRIDEIPPAAPELQAPAFDAEPDPVAAETSQPCPATAAAHADGRQVFGMTPPMPKSEAPRQIFGAAVTDGHVSQDLVRAAGYKASVFEQDQAQPLFTPRPAAPAETGTGPRIEPAAAPIAQPAESAPNVAQPWQAPPAPASSPSPAAPGLADLAARLAESMRRRREARAQAAAQPAAGNEPPEEAEAAAPQAAFNAEPWASAAPVSPRLEAFEPQAYTAPQPAVSAADPGPSALALPRAMQPLALDAFIEDDAAADPRLLPARHIAMPVTPVPAPAVQAPLELGSEDEVGEPSVNDEDFGSLLAINSSRNSFVRIEEPEAPAGEIEPVVIFPGQAPAQVASFAAASEQAAFRRFDAPAAGQGQPVAATSALPAVDQGEADQALRAALANLQRMSGAA